MHVLSRMFERLTSQPNLTNAEQRDTDSLKEYFRKTKCRTIWRSQ